MIAQLRDAFGSAAAKLECEIIEMDGEPDHVHLLVAYPPIRIYPTPEQTEYLNAQFGAVRFAYNKALHIKKHVYQRHGVNLNPRKDLKPLLAVAKKSHRYGWLKEYDSIALQQAVINLDVAFSNFFNPKLKARFPTFKSKHGKQSSYHCVGIKVIDGAIKIPKIAPIEARLHREITGTLKSITLSRSTTGKYYASLLCDDGMEAPEKPALLEIGTGIGYPFVNCRELYSGFTSVSASLFLTGKGFLLAAQIVAGVDEGARIGNFIAIRFDGKMRQPHIQPRYV